MSPAPGGTNAAVAPPVSRGGLPRRLPHILSASGRARESQALLRSECPAWGLGLRSSAVLGRVPEARESCGPAECLCPPHVPRGIWPAATVALEDSQRPSLGVPGLGGPPASPCRLSRPGFPRPGGHSEAPPGPLAPRREPTATLAVTSFLPSHGALGQVRGRLLCRDARGEGLRGRVPLRRWAELSLRVPTGRLLSRPEGEEATGPRTVSCKRCSSSPRSVLPPGEN